MKLETGRAHPLLPCLEKFPSPPAQELLMARRPLRADKGTGAGIECTYTLLLPTKFLALMLT